MISAMEKLFALIQGFGEYADRSEAPIGCFKTPADAWAYADWLKQQDGHDHYDYAVAEILVFATLEEAIFHGKLGWPHFIDEHDLPKAE
jgi:hypothetical protein